MIGTPTEPGRAGDRVEVVGHKVGEAVRRGTVREVLGEPGHVHYRVEWEDGHESVLYPGSDVHVVPAKPSRRSRSTKAATKS